MDFIDTMAEYLDGYRLDWDNSLTQKLARIEEKYPGFTERYKKFGEDVDIYRVSGIDNELIDLLHEGFVIDGIFEEDSREQFKLKWLEMEKRARVFDAEDIGLTRKEE